MRRREACVVIGLAVSSGCLRLREAAEETGGSDDSTDVDPDDDGEETDRSDDPEPASQLELSPIWERDRVLRQPIGTDRGITGVESLRELVTVSADGATVWRSEEISEAYSLRLDPTATAGEDAVYAGSRGRADDNPNARFYAFDPDDGSRRWMSETEPTGARTRIQHYTRANDIVAYGSDTGGTDGDQDSIVRAIDAGAGVEEWSVEFGESFIVGVESHGGRVFVGTTDGLSVYDADTGSTVETIDWILGFSGMAAADGRLYTYERGHSTVKALDMDTLETAWETESIQEPTTPAVGVGGIYVGDQAGFVRAYGLDSGDRRWETRIDGSVETGPIPDGNRLWVGNGRGGIEAIGAAAGERIYADTFGDDRVTVAVADDVLVTDSDQRGFAVRER